MDGLLERGLHGAALSEDGGGQVGLAAVTVVLGSSALVAGADGVPVVGVVVERGESVAQRFEVVEDVAEVSGRSLNLRVIVDFDAVLSFIMVEEELVVVANTCKREEAWGRLPANAESVFAVVVNLGLDWR